MSKPVFKLSVLAVALSLLVSGCTFPWWKKTATSATNQTVANNSLAASSTPAAFTNQLKKFNNYQELSQFLSANYNPDNSGAAGPVATDSTASTTPNNYLGLSPDSLATAASTGADIIKTDGTYVYALERSQVLILKIAPAGTAGLISKITFKSQPQALLLAGNFLAVYGPDAQNNANTFFKVFDVSDPLNPQPVRDLDFEGSYDNARLVGDYVYFLTTTPGRYESSTPVWPRVWDSGQALSTQCDGSAKCFAPEVDYLDAPYDSYHFANVAAINIKDNTAALTGRTYLLNADQSLYLGLNNLYLIYTPTVATATVRQAVTRAVVYPQLSATAQSQITAIEALPETALNNYEKKFKVAQIINNYIASASASTQDSIQQSVTAALPAALTAAVTPVTGQTIIYKISFSGNQFAYQAQGQVRGQVVGLSAVDENGDYLRLVTALAPTATSAAATDFYSNVYVLGPDLTAVGSLENLDTTVKINSARFIGSRVYLITLAASDPLYVVNLNDPTKPAVLGAVNIPGLSNYLQPLDNTGSQFVSLGWVNAAASSTDAALSNLQLSLFDFTDLSKPKELSTYVVGNAASDSIALADRATLFYSLDKNLLVVPATLVNASGRLTFSGALVFSTAGGQLSLAGKIDHSAGGHFNQTDLGNGLIYSDNTVLRSWLVNDDLLTFSHKYLQINNSAGLKALNSLELTTAGDDYMITSAAAACPVPELATSTPTSTPEQLAPPPSDTATSATSTLP